MKNVIAVVVALVALLLLSYVKLAAQAPNYVKQIGASGYQPPAIVVLKDTPDQAQVCFERSAGITACRSVGEFKAWVADRKKY